LERLQQVLDINADAGEAVRQRAGVNTDFHRIIFTDIVLFGKHRTSSHRTPAR
jgi:hypothetical protein